MVKSITLFASCILYLTQGYAQETSAREKHVEHSIELSGVKTSFQDVKFSNIRYKGIDTGFKYKSFVETDKHAIGMGLSFNYAKSKPSTFESENFGGTTVFNPTIFFSYTQNLDDAFSVGGQLNALEGFLRNTTGAGNNATDYNIGTHLYLRGTYQRKLNDDFSLKASLNYGIFGFMRESTGFAFSSPQEVTENGQFDYQNDGVSNPLKFRFYEGRPFWKMGNFQTRVEMNYKKRWTLAYTWNLRRFSTKGTQRLPRFIRSELNSILSIK
jgi:hypothetical protein